jgi:hypothetical protein
MVLSLVSPVIFVLSCVLFFARHGQRKKSILLTCSRSQSGQTRCVVATSYVFHESNVIKNIGIRKDRAGPDDAKSYVSKCHNVQSKSFSDIKCANMSDMFEGAASFRQDVASWGSGWFGTRFAWYDECDDGL